MSASLSLRNRLAAQVRDIPRSGIRDFFEDGRMGYAIDSSDPGDYTELLDRLVSYPELCATMGQYNREFARQRFAASVVAARLSAIYVQVTKCVA